jgi:hypothetical protein
MEQSAKLAMIFMAMAVLIPLVPAFILFKMLPATGSLSGPWQGLNIKFSGAFAGYLIIFLCLLWIRPVDFNHYHTWKVSGRLEIMPAKDETAPNIHDVVVRVVPPHLDVMNEGKFSFEVPVLENARGVPEFPALQLDLKGYQGVTVSLSQGSDKAYGSPDLKRRYDEEARTISIDAPIILLSLASVPRYDPQRSEQLTMSK